MNAKQILVNFIYQFHGVSNAQWRIGGELQRPTKDDIEKVLDRLREMVYDKDNTQAETGGIIVKKNGDHTAVYLYIGEL